MGSDTQNYQVYSAFFLEHQNSLYSWSQIVTNGLEIIEVDIQSNSLNLPLSVEESGITLKSLCKRESSNLRKATSSKRIRQQPCVFDAKQFSIKSQQENGFKNSMKLLKIQALQGLFGVCLDHVMVDVEILPEKLVICYPGEKFHDTLNWGKKPGVFGCLLIAIPVKNGKGGRVTVKNNNQEVVHYIQTNGEAEKFYVTCMAAKRITEGEQMYVVEPTGSSVVAFLACNLVWADAMASATICTDEFIAYIRTVHQVNQALANWRTTSSDENREEKKEASALLLPELLCISLKNNYNGSTFNCSTLVEEDWLMFRVLRALDYINVNLAVVIFRDHDRPSDCNCYNEHAAEERKRLEQKGKSPKKNFITFKYWLMDSNINNSNGKNNWCRACLDTQLLGNLEGSLDLDENIDLMVSGLFPDYSLQNCVDDHPCNSNYDRNRRGQSFCADCYRSFHPGLIIEPKWSKTNKENYDFRAVLRDLASRFPEAVEKMSRGSFSVRNAMCSDIRKLVRSISECYWPTEKCAGFNVPTLLNYCIRLNAAKEGLLILQVVVDYDCPCREHDWLSTYDEQGSRCILVAHVADFISQISGWDAISDVMFRMITKWKSSPFFHQLTDRLLDGFWFHEAFLIVEAVINQLSAFTEDELDDCPVNVIGQLAVALSRIARANITDISQEYDSVIQIFRKLPHGRLCCEIETFFNHLENGQENILISILKDLASDALKPMLNNILECHFLYLIKVYTKSNIQEACESLWSQVLEDLNDNFSEPIREKCPERDAPFFVRLLLTIADSNEDLDNILKSLLTSTFSSQIFDLLVEQFPLELAEHGKETNSITEIDLTSESDDNRSNTERNVSYLTVFFRFITSAENLCNQYNKSRLNQFQSNFSRLQMESTWRLVLRVCSEEAGHFKKFKKSKETCKSLLKWLLTFNIFELVKSAGEEFKKVFQAFVWLEDLEVLEELVEKLAHSQKSATRKGQNVESQYAFLRHLTSVLEIPGIYGGTDEWKLPKLDRKTADLIMATWIKYALAFTELEKCGEQFSIEILAVRFYTSFASSEKYINQEEERPFIQLFAELFKKLSTESILKFIEHLMTLEMNGKGPGLPKLRHSSALMKKVFLELLNRPQIEEIFSSSGKLSQALCAVESFFWLGDEEILVILLKKLCSNPSSPNSANNINLLELSIIKSETVRMLASEAPCGMNCLKIILDHLIAKTNAALIPKTTWAFHQCSSFSSQLQLEMFLKTDRPSQVFGKFSTKEMAEKFVERNVKSSWNISYEIVKHSPRVFFCKLVKQNQRIVEATNKYVLEKELKKLNRLRNSFKEPIKETFSTMANRKRRLADLRRSAGKPKRPCSEEIEILPQISNCLCPNRAVLSSRNYNEDDYVVITSEDSED